jgi:hypothetical protein
MNPVPDIVRPADILRRPMAVGCFQNPPLVHPDKTEPAGLEHKPVRAPQLGEVRRAGFGPLLS